MDCKKRTYPILALILCVVIIAAIIAAPRISRSIGVCAEVTIQILQELTLERIAFDARMAITNNIPDKNLTNIRVDVMIKDADGNVKNDLFFVRVASNSNLQAVDGTGTVTAGTKGEVHWLIIPSPGAGGADPAGIAYYVGATLMYSIDGEQQTVSVNPARIIVKPEPQLILDYFTPYEVIGDNPFTKNVEAPVPFPLAVRVLNAGYGPASKLKIDSAQPKIVANEQGLLVNFRLLGASVNDSAVANSLTVDIGTLGSMKIATAYWDMISTLTGKFVEFKVTFSHASELGGDLTSLIKETNAYYLVHKVKVNLPGRDNHLDFLADTRHSVDHVPDTIFESEIPGNTGKIEDSRSPVTVLTVIGTPARPTTQSPEVQLSVPTGQTGWVYTRIADPGMGMLKLLDVVRLDGVHLDPNNFWVQEGVDANFQKIFTLHLLDYRADATAPGTYKLVYTKPAEDTIPPSTQLIYDGPNNGTNPVYITTDTRVVFLATDNDGGSGVDQMLRKIEGEDPAFTAAYPLNLYTAGTYTLEYYSIDRAGNKEAVKTAYIVVDSGTPSISSYQATPSTIMPHAPRGVAAPRTANFSVRATDDQPTLQATIDIANGSTFSPTGIIRTLKSSITKDIDAKIAWDAKDSNGKLVPTGTYTARLSVTDGLESSGTTSHTASAIIPVTVADWFVGQPVDPNPAAAQQHPKIAGTRAVWQDQRNGKWQIYTKDLMSGASTTVSHSAGDQTYPSIYSSASTTNAVIVWQDNRSGNWDIYGYDMSQAQEFVICNDAGNQERPVIAGEWIAWQDDRNGNWDIYAYNLTTHEQIQVTNHVRDQLHPALSGTTLSWEDYRFGLGEIFTYDLVTKAETRYTVDSINQTFPTVSGNTLVWTDQRNNQRDIYFSPSADKQIRVTYGTGDHSQAVIQDNVVVYTDYESGLSDPNLAFYDARSGVGALLSANPARQEEPALGTGVLVWQDDRDGISQIYWSNFQVESIPISADIKPGLNLIAVGDRLARTYPTTSSLISASTGSLGISKIVVYNSQTNAFMDTWAGAEIALQPGMAIGLYAANNGSLDVADSGETAQYTLLPGMNYAGMLSVPNGYTAYNLLQSLGFDNVQSVRRFNNQVGAWETATVRDSAGVKSATGSNFAIHQGDGLVIMMKSRVDGWKP